MRPRLQTIDLTTEPPEARVEVQLQLPGRAPLRGSATGAATAVGQARTGAEATIDALRDLLPQVRLVLDEVVVHQGIEGRWVTVLATALGRGGVERLVGSALVEGGVHRAGVHATLQACNRRLGDPEDGIIATADRGDGAADATGPVAPADWRDPMAVLLGTLRVLRRHVDDLDDAERLGLLDAGIIAADRLVGTLGDVAPSTALPRSCRVEAVVVRAVESVGARGPVRVDCPPDVHATAAPDDLHRMVVTGVDAVRRHAASPVVVAVAVAGPWVRITVRGDEPGGTDDGDRGRAGRDPRSTGLGLEIVRLLAEANGGTATIEGAGFPAQAVRVRLPVA